MNGITINTEKDSLWVANVENSFIGISIIHRPTGGIDFFRLGIEIHEVEDMKRLKDLLDYMIEIKSKAQN